MASSTTGKALGSLLTELRHRGARGGTITPHRAMRGLRWSSGRVVRAGLLAALFTALVAALLPALGHGYALVFEQATWWFGIPAGVGIEQVPLWGPVSLPVPYLRLGGPWPNATQWWAVGGFTAFAMVASFLLPVRWLPLRYLLRFVALAQGVSLGWFALNAPPFLYPLPAYTSSLMQTGLVLLLLLPLILGFTFYIFDHGLPRQVAITVLMLGHMAVFLPLQVLLHAALVHHLSALVQPTLFFVFGTLAQVLVFVGFYGWAMSWPGTELTHDAPGGAR